MIIIEPFNLSPSSHRVKFKKFIAGFLQGYSAVLFIEI